MKINSNTTAYITANYLFKSENALQKSMKKLSSGYKINGANDDPAGYAISSYMRSQIDALSKASINTTNGISVIETTEGAVSEMQEMVQRMSELAVKAANGTMSESDRESIQEEMDALSEEIERLAKETDFNTMTLLDGSFENKGYTNDLDVKVKYYSDDTKFGTYTFNIKRTADDRFEIPSDELAKLSNNVTVTSDETGNMLLKSNDGTEVCLKVDPDELAVGDTKEVKVDLTGIGAMRLQIGANEGQILELSIPQISLEKLGIEDLDCTTEEGATKAIKQLDNALSFTNFVRSKLGAYQNRLEHASASLDITSENLTGSYSCIVDTDMAEEMTEYTKLQVLQQAGTSMLAQANEYPQQALQLLQ